MPIYFLYLSLIHIYPATGAILTQTVNYANSIDTTIRVDPSMVQNYVANVGWTAEDVRTYIKDQCREEVGSNKYCYMVTNPSDTNPSQSDILDSFNQSDVYNYVMLSGGVDRLGQNQSKIYEWLSASVVGSVQTCAKTLTDCAINACGRGSMAVCYAVAKDSTGNVDIKGDNTNVEVSCQKLAQNDQSCKDVFLTDPGDATDLTNMWTQIWGFDKTNALANLTKKLTTSFSETSIAGIRRQCEADIENCATNACGGQYLDTCCLLYTSRCV